MAAGSLGKPGTERGPCATACRHIDCREIREWARALCHYCGKEIGYETRFYRQGEDEEPHTRAVASLEDAHGRKFVLVHAGCAEAAVDVEG
ncbi:MAG TPA: hypothetical protein VH439_17180 [Gemmatimonadales bacterium]